MAITDQLWELKGNEQLINLYQMNSSDFYTGFIQTIGPDGVILNTYNENGIQDGSVFIKLNAIERIEDDGADIENIEFRMQVTERDHLLSNQAFNRPLDLEPEQPLLPQLIVQLQTRSQAVLLTTAAEDGYFEGKILNYDATNLDLKRLNKFQYEADAQYMFAVDDIQVLEFNGLELFLETRLIDQGIDQHKEMKVELDHMQMYRILKHSLQTQQLIALRSDSSNDNFSVGTIEMLNQNSLIIKLLDMTGKFGGYTLLRLSALEAVSDQWDYLTTIGFYRDESQKLGIYLQPVLNDERLFDGTVDQFQTLIREQSVYREVVSLRLHQQIDAYLGFPISTLQPPYYQFNAFLDRDPDIQQSMLIMPDEVDELSFGFLQAYLDEQQLKAQDSD